MDILSRILVLFLRLFRNGLDYVSTLAFEWFYEGKQEKLPPIEDVCLLEPAHVLASKIRRRELRSVDVVRAYIHRIRQVQPFVNAIVEDCFAEAVEAAIEVDRLVEEGGGAGEEETPFLGVPVTIKEAIALKGCLYTVGLAARRGMRAESDSDVVSLLRRAGAIPIAVTITPELCFWWESYNTLYGVCKNPYDTTRTAGGSSGGEGAILGAAGSVIGVGNDIGGSIRIPAFFNGIFGHKPTRGVVSNGGQYPTAAPALQSFLIAGPMCRYASDLLPMMRVLASDHHRQRLKMDEQVNLKDLKIYYMENEGGNPLISAVDPEILNAQQKVLKHFSTEYGLTPTLISDVPHLQHCFETWSKVLTASDLRPVDEEMTGRKGRAYMPLEILKWALGVSNHILPVLISALLGRAWAPQGEKGAEPHFRKMREMEEFFEGLLKQNGIFIFPTNPDLALHHGHAILKPFGVSYTALFNLLGLPVSQCPVGLSSKGLPVGLQVVGPHCGDRLTIAVAMEIERVFGGWVPPSPVDVV
ncbi:hypothetical protein JTE90_006844 [Oedothorax gibbosus]|uniref:Amidase domain-containing protein n=1 Tax=Oedothorax gibbosus TaxID=931172 RepID=A0AAV6TVG9_9ARAC|nr:hypothetical protein JTE90_006844 [Oedothorax gibbosus]